MSWALGRITSNGSRFESQLATAGTPFTFEGYCYVCRSHTQFDVDYRYAYMVDAILTPNWREQLLCRQCGLNNRMRAAIHIFTECFRPPSRAKDTPCRADDTTVQMVCIQLYDLSDSNTWRIPFHTASRHQTGIRSEDLTALTFSDDKFDYVLTFDVFEHVPAVKQAFAECWRVLVHGGRLFFSVPFLLDSPTTVVRAVQRDDGVVEHLLPPEYHGDPMKPEGCLAFYQFGWEMLDLLNDTGFKGARSCLYWSESFGYLGAHRCYLGRETIAAARIVVVG